MDKVTSDASARYDHKQAAMKFLDLVTMGNIDEAYEKFVDPDGKHHNPFFPADFQALREGMKENHTKFPVKQFTVKNVLADGDLVAIHSHIILNPDEPGMAVVHIFRFRGDKIVELWDCGQPVPADSPNQAGMF
jgi:predicted SnoaL-like aldol condensation-catalyzing enzyme